MQRATAAFDFKILMMGYYNSILQMGHERFCACLSEHGGEGFIVADLPPEEAEDLHEYAAAYRQAPIVMMTPVNSAPRLREIAARASGFVYCVARRGVTGRHTPRSTKAWKPSSRAAVRPRPCRWRWDLASARTRICSKSPGSLTSESLAPRC